MRIAEIYSSRQGEGLLTGTPSVFVRASGCNLRCWFCDTPYTSWQPEGEDWSVEEIFADVQRLQALDELPAQGSRLLAPRDESFTRSVRTTVEPIRHAVITGGEPMLFAELIPLCEKLHAAGLHITIETAGTLFLPLACDLMSISPKLASSTPGTDVAGNWSDRHERTRHRPEVIRKLLRGHEYQLKFVIDRPGDCEAVQDWLVEFPEASRGRVLLMPQGVERDSLERTGEWLAPYCREHGFVFCPRKHIEWYGARRGT